MTSKKSKPSKKPFTTVHSLSFEVAPWERSEDWLRFRVGTCSGLWRSTSVSYAILAVTNDEPGNGHFEDVLQWFEHSCRRDGRALCMLVVANKRFKQHLIEKRDFIAVGNNCVKIFT